MFAKSPRRFGLVAALPPLRFYAKTHCHVKNIFHSIPIFQLTSHYIHAIKPSPDNESQETAGGVPIYMVPSHIINDPEAVKQVKEFFNASGA